MSDIDVCGSASTQQQRQPHPALLSYLYVLLMGYRPRLLLFPHPKKLETNFLLLLLLYDKQECQLSSSSSPRDGSRLSSATACAETTSCSPPLCISPFLFRAWWLSRGFSLLLATSGCAETVPVVKWPMICWHILDGCAAVQSPCITNNMLCHRQWMYIYPRDTLRRPLKLLDDVARKSSSFLFRKEADQSSGRLRL